jgi:hypothetical protein
LKAGKYLFPNFNLLKEERKIVKMSNCEIDSLNAIVSSQTSEAGPSPALDSKLLCEFGIIVTLSRATAAQGYRKGWPLAKRPASRIR